MSNIELSESQMLTFMRTYSRWRDDLRRRETYEESGDRWLNFFSEELGDAIAPVHKNFAKTAWLQQQVMPSMRAAWAAGPAAKKNNITLYNCAFSIVDSLDMFPEVLYILMCGTGIGFSVEKKYVDKLPTIELPNLETVEIIVEDSKEGWAKAFSKVIHSCQKGISISKFDYSHVRPRGSRLLTMGGRASGPEPLKNLFDFTIKLFSSRRGQKLRPIDCHDLCCKIAEIVVVGGVRRSSLISLSDLDDHKLATAKMGAFWDSAPHRSMSNNSAVHSNNGDEVVFMKEWLNLMESGSGERGIFSREGALRQMAASGRRKYYEDIGTNPCGEILLRDMQFCNLSEVVVRSDDNMETLRRKVRTAAMLGSWQATFTKFPYLRPNWKTNCEEERLLGVSLTGLMDHPILNNVNDTMKKWLGELKGVAIRETDKWADRLGINMSAAVTCVKPSGTVSQLVNCSSGIHARYAQHYIRRYRISATDPLFKMLKEQSVPYFPEVGQSPDTASTFVLEFPVAAPLKSKTRHDYTAIQQLEHWKVVKEFWTEHNPSITVYVNQGEWLQTGAWCYKHFDSLCGVSFLPKDNGVYQLAPYEEISKEQYLELENKFPKIDYNQLSKYEQEDNTQGSRVYACVGDKCELQ
jgi:ribonucleoside-triphosphate reductase (thioredoxin)